VAETMQFNTDLATAVNINVDAKIQEMVFKGWAIDGGVWSHVTQRRANLILTLAILLDEMRTNETESSVFEAYLYQYSASESQVADVVFTMQSIGIL
jgi:hypothetical protein